MLITLASCLIIDVVFKTSIESYKTTLQYEPNNDRALLYLLDAYKANAKPYYDLERNLDFLALGSKYQAESNRLKNEGNVRIEEAIDYSKSYMDMKGVMISNEDIATIYPIFSILEDYDNLIDILSISISRDNTNIEYLEVLRSAYMKKKDYENAKRFKDYIFSLNISFNYNSFRAIFGIGFTSGLQYIFEVGAFTVATVIIGSIGSVQLASHQIALNLASISYMVASGIGSAAMISLGYYYGVGDKSEIRKSGYSNFILVLILMSISAFIFIVFRDILPTFYVDDIEVIILASSLLILAGLFQLSDGIQAVGLGILRGIRDTKIPTLITFISYWVIAIPLSYYLGIILDYGLFGVWIGLSVGLTIAAVFHVLRFNYLTSIK